MRTLKFIVLSFLFFSLPIYASLKDDSGSADILELDYGIRPNLDGFLNYGVGGSLNYGKYAATDFEFDRQADKEEGTVLETDVTRTRDRLILNTQVLRWRNLFGSQNAKKAWGCLVVSPYAGLYWLQKDATTETFQIKDTSTVNYMEYNAGVNFKWQFVEWMEIGGGYRYYLFSNYTTNGTRKNLSTGNSDDYSNL